MLAELNRRFGIPGIAEVAEGKGGLLLVKVKLPHVEGEIYLHGAHVTSWKPADTDEVVFVSSKSRWQDGQAIRGGIPICFPWFRSKVENPHAPAHGFVRTRAWQIESIIKNEEGITVSMFIESDAQTQHWWPGKFRLVHRVTFGTALRLELICANIGASPFQFEEALHTYYHVADIHRTRLHGLDTTRFLDNTDSNREKTQHGDLTISAQTDNAYLDTENAVDLIDLKLLRQIQLQKKNSRNTVVWNPWQEGAAKMQDLGDGEWNQFICVEGCNIRADAITLAPGQQHKMTAVLNVSKF